jgi:hypothetical protein
VPGPPPVYDQAMARGRAPLRRAVLLAGAAYAVHQLRFVLTYGADTHRVLHEEGHRYLPFAGAAAALLLLAGATQFATSLLRCATGGAGPGRPPARLCGLWAGNAALLVATYVAQEGLEGAFASGHPIWAHGGWVVVPLAVVLGGLVALLVVGAHRALAEVARRSGLSAETRRAEQRRPRPRSAVLAPLSPLARHLAGRAPPAGRAAVRPPAVTALS